MFWILMIPFAVQAFAIFFDEYYFHVKRGLPKWERIGHPLDTLSVAACMGFLSWTTYSPSTLKVYIALAVFSCLMVTKDEFVHKHHCPAAEHWIHALLFINHPIMLASGALMWINLNQQNIAWVGMNPQYGFFLWMQTGVAICFMLYQIIYWNFIWDEKKA